MCSCSSHHNSLHIALFRACNISKCSSRDALHCVPLCHAHLSPLDAQISGARVLYDVYCWYLSELGVLLFLLHLMCASYGHELYRCFDLCHAIFTEVYAMYFCDLCGD